MGNPFVALVFLLFIIAGFYHSQLGLQVVIEDYIHHEGIKTLSLLAVSLGTFALGIASIFAVLKLSFGG
jgi:succinate dehydrogenase / fumarate reductase membrane anchor subunit